MDTTDSTLAEFLIHLHGEAKDFNDFRAKVNAVGAEFPESFLTSVDRTILSMHPKYKKKKKKVKGAKKGGATEGVVDEEKARQARLFPGLSMPDQEWEPSYKVDSKDSKGKAVDLGVDDLMAELEGVNKRAASSSVAAQDDRGGKRTRDTRSRSPPDRRRGRSPDYKRGSGSGYGRRDDDRGRDGYGGRGGGVGPPRLDAAPVMYKVYPGKVSSMKDFGAFISLEGVAGRAEGELGTCCPLDTHS